MDIAENKPSNVSYNGLTPYEYTNWTPSSPPSLAQQEAAEVLNAFYGSAGFVQVKVQHRSLTFPEFCTFLRQHFFEIYRFLQLTSHI